MRPLVARLLLAAAASCAPLVPSHAQEPPLRKTDVFRGRVLGDSGARAQPLAGATIIVTRADRSTETGLTGSTGRFEFAVSGEGDYLVHVIYPGRATIRRRVTRAAGGALDELIFHLPSTVAQLEAVQVRARRDPIGRTHPLHDVGSAEVIVEASEGALVPELAGRLDAIAALTPGVTPVAGGFSVLGHSPAENSILLNGLAFSGGQLPRDARVRTRVASTSYDPARGGFSGGQVSVELAPGSRYSSRRAHITADAPFPGLDDRSSPGSLSSVRRLQLSAGADGEALRDRWFYNWGAQVAGRRGYARPLGSARPSGLTPARWDSVPLVLARAGRPSGALDRSEPSDDGSASLLLRIDRTPGARHAMHASAYGFLGRGDVPSVGYSTPSTGLRSSRSDAQLQFGASSLLGNRETPTVLSDTRLSISRSEARETPRLGEPSGVLLLTDADGSLEVPLYFGGGGFQTRHRGGVVAEGQHQTQWLPGAGAHRATFTTGARLDALRAEPATNTLGNYTFRSFEDLLAGRPELFARSVESPQSARIASGHLSVSDLWRASQRLTLQYGVRAEGTRYPTGTSEEWVVAAIPDAQRRERSSIDVSPRFGFTWRYSGHDREGAAVSGPLGSFLGRSPASLRGGVGRFRSFAAQSVIGEWLGLGGELLTETCTGGDIPEWRPGGGGAGCTTADAGARSARFVGASTDPASSWRGSLAWEALIGRVAVSLEGIASRTSSVATSLDRNLVDTPRFILPDEGGRPVFVPASAIDTRSGVSLLAASRRLAGAGRLLERESGGRLNVHQVTLRLVPELGGAGSRRLSLAYAWTEGTANERGALVPTFADPRLLERHRAGNVVRHRFLLDAGYAFRRGAVVSMFASVSSGVFFTPLVDRDANGDGAWGDRAWIPPLGEEAPGELPAALRAAIPAMPAYAQRCIRRQAGGAAGVNSCQGPWSTQVNARGALSSGRVARWFGGSAPAQIGVSVMNAPAAIDRLLHGAARRRGWGTASPPDPMLLLVRGFDPARRAFLYEPNPGFGSVTSARARIPTPFVITLDVSLDLSTPYPAQRLARALGPGRGHTPGPRLTAQQIRGRYSVAVPDPYIELIEESDSLLLRPEQVLALEEGRRAYRQRVDSILGELANFLSALPDRYDARAAERRASAALDAAWEATFDEAPRIRAILRPTQLIIAPEVTAAVLARRRINIRVFQ